MEKNSPLTPYNRDYLEKKRLRKSFRTYEKKESKLLEVAHAWLSGLLEVHFRDTWVKLQRAPSRTREKHNEDIYN